MLVALLAVVAAPGTRSARAETPVLVSDLDPRGRSSHPHRLTEVAGALYFGATDPVRGLSLWRTDGSQAGTTFVHDAFPGTSDPWSIGYGAITRRGTDLFFVTERQQETDDGCCNALDTLWRSDGTGDGTAPLLTWHAGEDSVPDLVVVGGTVYFTARNAAHGRELWASDGTPAGTRMVADLRPGRKSSAPSAMVAYRDRLWFGTRDALWQSDGSAPGTHQVLTVPGRPSQPIVVSDRLYFVAPAGSTGVALWSSDGTAAGTHVVADTGSGSDGGSITELTAFAGGLAFVAGDGTHGRQLWMTDGTPSGTRALTDLDTSVYVDQAWELTAAGQALYFVPDESVHGSELWRSDGTPGGTALVLDLRPGPAGAVEDYDGRIRDPHLTAFADQVFFLASDGIAGPEPWLSDGTASGTHLVRDVWPGPEGSQNESYDSAVPVVLGDRVFFAAEDPHLGNELWTTDGTTDGTRLVRDILPSGLGAGVMETAAFDGHLVFTRDFTQDGNGSLWQTDGSATGTIQLAPPSTVHPPRAPSVAGGRLYYFHADQNENTNELWTSDGTVTGTWGLGGWVDGDYAWCVPGDPLHGLFLAGCHSAPYLAYEYEGNAVSGGLLRSDGTDAGTGYLIGFRDTSERRMAMVTDVVRSSGSAFFLVQRAVSADAQQGSVTRASAALWRTDGTKAGTRRVVSLDLGPTYQLARPGSAHPPRLLMAAPGRIHLIGRDAGHGMEPWISDGTARGTRLLADVHPGPAGSYPSHLARLGHLVTFSADDGRHGREPWVSDGTRRGTRLLRDLRPGPAGSTPSAVVTAGSRGYFAADDGVHGRELWVTDGTTAGTRMLRDIAPGRAGSRPTALTGVGDRLYFAADDGVHGRELWVTDGTTAGTRRVADLWRGPLGSRPTHLTSVAGTLYFVADDGVHGREVWRLAR